MAQTLKDRVLRESDPEDTPPPPPGQTPGAPVKEPPDRPKSGPDAPVGEPGPAPPKKYGCGP
jgi:hypothetical protein